MIRARDNPLAPCRLERVLAFQPAWAGTSWEKLLESLSRCNGRAAIVGPHGAGKTTLLEALASQLEKDGRPVIRLFFNRQNRMLGAAHLKLLKDVAGKHLLVDGDHHLSWSSWIHLHRTAKAAATLVLTRHRRSLLLPTLVRLKSSLTLLHDCVRSASPEFYQALAPHLSIWYANRKGNLREALQDAYDFLSRSEATSAMERS